MAGNKYSLTEIGVKKEQQGAGESQNLRYAIIEYMGSHGNEASVDELSDALNVHPLEVRKKLQQLQRERWVELSNWEDDDWD